MFDYIIPVVYNDNNNDYEYRAKNINLVLSTIPSNIKMTIVEQINSNNSIYDVIDDKYKKLINYIPVYYSGHFIKGWLYNIGVRNTTNQKILLAESDNYQTTMYYGYINEYLQKHSTKWLLCWSKIIYFDEDNNPMKTVTGTKNHTGPEGGLVYFDRDFYENKFYGCSEWFCNLGGIDNDTSWRAHHISKQYERLQGTIYHYWHPRSELKGENDDVYKKTIDDNRKKYNFMKKYISIVCNEYSKFKGEFGGEEPLFEKYPLVYNSDNYDGEYLRANENRDIIHRKSKNPIIRRTSKILPGKDPKSISNSNITPRPQPEKKPMVDRSNTNRRIIRKIF